MQANKYQAIFYMTVAIKEKYRSERSRLIVEIYELGERFEKWKTKAPEGTENNFQDMIDLTKDELTRLDEKHKIALDLMQSMAGGMPLD